MTKLENQDASLPTIGSSLTVNYKVDPNGEAVDTEWMILGYNKDIPRFVKYKNGNDRVYMDVLPGDLLLDSFGGANVYSNKDGTGFVGTVTATGGRLFSYGNNNQYSVPEAITVNGTTYEFCGYNMTIQSKLGLVAKYNNVLYINAQFNSTGRNDWGESEIRTWLNGTEAVSTQTLGPTSGSLITETTGLLGRLPDEDFTRNVISTVTRTWVHSDLRTGKTLDSNYCQHLADRFRMLGVGEVNCKGTNTTNYFPDGGYDTSRFDEVFNRTDIWTNEKTRIRCFMNEDGTEGDICSWYLRSTFSDNSYTVGCVSPDGYVGNGRADSSRAVLPACLIG